MGFTRWRLLVEGSRMRRRIFTPTSWNVWSLKKLWHYLFGREVKVKTKNNVVKWLREKKELGGKFARWMMDLHLRTFLNDGPRPEYVFTIQHVNGSKNVVADSLSRFFSFGVTFASWPDLCAQTHRILPWRIWSLARKGWLDKTLALQL